MFYRTYTTALLISHLLLVQGAEGQSEDSNVGVNLIINPSGMTLGSHEVGDFMFDFDVALDGPPKDSVKVTLEQKYREPNPFPDNVQLKHLSIQPSEIYLTPNNWTSGETVTVSHTSNDIDKVEGSLQIVLSCDHCVADNIVFTVDFVKHYWISIKPDKRYVKEGESIIVTARISEPYPKRLSFSLGFDYGYADDQKQLYLPAKTREVKDSFRIPGSEVPKLNYSFSGYLRYYKDPEDDLNFNDLCISRDCDQTPPPDVKIGNPRRFSGTILVGEIPQLELPDTVYVDEGKISSFDVKLSSIPIQDVTVTIRGYDYTVLDTLVSTPRKLTFSSEKNQKSRPVTVGAVHDADTSDDIVPLIFEATRGIETEITDTVYVKIKDDDRLAEASLVLPKSITVPEGSSVPFNVSLSAAPTGEVTVDIPSFAEPSDILSWSPDALEFTPSSYGIPLSVKVSADPDDNTLDETETLTLTASGGGYDDVTGKVEVTVVDQGAVPVRLLATPRKVDEGDSVEVTVELTRALKTTELKIPLIYEEVGEHPASKSIDYSDLVYIEIPRGLRRVTEKISTTDDQLAEKDETFKVALGKLLNEVQHGNPWYREITIVDNDKTPVVVTLSVPRQVTEGDEVTVTATLSTAALRPVMIPIKCSPEMPDDYSCPTHIRIDLDDDSGSAPIETYHDDIVEGNETFTVGIGTPLPLDYIAGNPKQVTIEEIHAKGIELTPPSLNIQEGGPSKTYTVVLSSAPTSHVEITLSGDQGKATLTPASLPFKPLDWDDPKTVTVQAVDDPDTKDETLQIIHTARGGGYDDVTGKVEVTVVDLGAVSVRLLAPPPPLTVDEGESVEVTVELTRALKATLKIPLIYAGVGEHPASGSDYSGETLITIPTGKTSVPVTILTTNDQTAEKDETFSVALDIDKLPDEVQPGSPDRHQITIDDNDKPPPVQARLSVAPNPVDEGKPATVTAMLDYTLDEPVTITVKCTPLRATTDPERDYKCPDSITIPRGAESGSAELKTHADDDTDDEQVSVALGTHPSVEIGPPPSIIVTINDKTPVVVTLSVPRQVTEGDEVTVIAELSTAALRPVMIPIECSPVMPNDYACPNQIPIASGEASGSERIKTYPDDIVEGNETFTVEIGTQLPQDYIAGNSQQVTILDYDQAEIILSPTSLTVDEGFSAGYTITLSSEPQSSVTLKITGITDRITWLPPVLTFNASNWNSPKEVMVEALLDYDAVPETVILSHTPSSLDPNYSGFVERLPVTVTDTGTKDLVIRPPDLTIPEGTPDDFTVALSAEPQGSVTVEIGAFLNGELTRDQNFLTFTPSDWADEQPVRVDAAPDEDAEPDPTETLTLTARGGGYDGVMGNVQVTIEETGSKGIVLAPTSLDIEEGGPPKTYTVELSSAPTSHVEITLSGDQGKATLAPMSLPFTASDWKVPKTVTVQAVDDPDTDDETLQIIHTASGGGYDDTEPTELDLRINDKGEAPLTLSIYDAQAQERDGKVSLRVELNRTTDVPVIATYETVDGTAKSAEDYVRSRGLVLFDPGSRTGQIQIELVSDNIDESEEQFTVKLTSARPEVTIARDVGQVTIFDKARAVAVRIDDAVITEESMQFTVQLSMPSATAIVVHYRTEDGTASANEDYRSSAGALTFAPGEIEQTIEVELVPTKENQQGKTFVMRLENTSEGTIDKAVATATIEGADAAIAVEAMKAYAVRFVRTSTIQIVEALRHRPTGSSCLAGQRMELAQLWATDWTPSLGELLAGCRMMQEQERNRGWLSVWGQGAFTRLRSNDVLNLRGEVSTAMLGTDYRWQSGWLTGIMVTHSQGDGSYRMLEQSVQTSLTQVVPYVSVQGIDWGAWLALGYGRGQIEVEALEGSLASVFGAAGIEGKWMSSSTAGLNIHGDVLVAGAEVDKYEVRGEVVRVRVGLQGVLKLHDRVRPYIEANVRQDGGSAEAGIGLELGGGLRFASGRLKAELRTQGLLLHSADGFTEWGASGYVQVGGGPVGWMMTVRPSWGLGYGRQLHRQQTILDATPGNLQRTEVELAYGVPLKGGVARSVMGVTQLSRGRMYRLGTQLRPWEQMSISVFGLAHSKRELGLNVRGAINY